MSSVTLSALIEAHGYWVLAAGCLLEGETVLLLAGYAAHRGYLDPLAVVGIAAASGFVADQFYFLLGRRHGSALLARWPALAAQAARAGRLIARHPAGAAIGVRFAYGLRIAGPVLIGMSPLSPIRFAFLDALGALLWACIIGAAGWAFGEIHHVGIGLLVGAVAALIVWRLARGRAAHFGGNQSEIAP